MKNFSTPIDRVAARIVQKGVHYEPHIKGQKNYDAPLKTVDTKNKMFTNQKTFKDYTGTKFGSFTVIGLTEKGASWGRWICKCICGQYETRTAKSIRNHLEYKDLLDEDMCASCNDLHRLKIAEKARQAGLTYLEYVEKNYPRRKSLKEILREKKQ